MQPAVFQLGAVLPAVVINADIHVLIVQIVAHIVGVELANGLQIHAQAIGALRQGSAIGIQIGKEAGKTAGGIFQNQHIVAVDVLDLCGGVSAGTAKGSHGVRNAPVTVQGALGFVLAQDAVHGAAIEHQILAVILDGFCVCRLCRHQYQAAQQNQAHQAR